MKLFIDTANIDEIKEANALGISDGVTTNPSLIAKEGKDFIAVVKEICSIVDGPISAEAISSKSDEIVKEARQLAKLHKKARRHRPDRYGFDKRPEANIHEL